jgi:NTE family protein
MVFHLGCLIRLNEVGLMQKLKRVSSVSGGSLTAAVLGWRWKDLRFDPHGVAKNLEDLVVRPIRNVAGVTLDAGSVIGGIFRPFRTINDNVIAGYRKHLFGDRGAEQSAHWD